MQLPQVIEFQTTTACNARCNICPWPDVRGAGRPKKMPDDVWEKLLHDLEELKPKRVIPYLNNEPLTDIYLEDRIKILRDILGCPEIEISTNAVLLTLPRTRTLMNYGVTELYVSIFGYDSRSQYSIMALDFERVRENVLNALSLRDNLKSHTKIIVIQVNSPDIDAAQLAKERRFWEKAGADVKIYGYLDRAGNVSNTLPQRNYQLLPRGCELNRHQERMYVLTDGTVIFCCHDWRVVEPMGNLMNSSLKEIWLSPRYNDLRLKIEGKIQSADSFLCRKCKLCLTTIDP